MLVIAKGMRNRQQWIYLTLSFSEKIKEKTSLVDDRASLIEHFGILAHETEIGIEFGPGLIVAGTSLFRYLLQVDWLLDPCVISWKLLQTISMNIGGSL